MYNNKSVLCIIPARGGSKGLPGKNIRPLSGKPLIAWTIEETKESKYPDMVFVSTDDTEIAEISKRYGAEVPFLRPEEFARDDSPIIDTIIHTLDYFKNEGTNFDIVALLEPTSPLRGPEDIDNAIKLLIDSEKIADSLVSVGEVQLENPYITKFIVEGYVKPVIQEDAKKLFQRQKLPKVYFPYGVIYASKVLAMREKGTFYQETTLPYFIERWQNYEIDDMYDFVCVEAVLKQKKSEDGK